MRRPGSWALGIVALIGAIVLGVQTCVPRAPDPEPSAAPSSVESAVETSTQTIDERRSRRRESEEVPAPATAPTGGVVYGTVTADNGAATGNAAVRLTPDEDHDGAVIVRCAADGTYRAEGLSPARWKVVCAGGGFGTRLDVEGTEATFISLAQNEEKRVDLVVSQLAIVAGTVTDADGGLIAGAQVQVQCDAFLSPGGAWLLKAATGEDGRFERTSVTPGSFLRVIVEAPGGPYWEQVLHDVQPGERVELAIRIPPSVRFRLVLRDAATGAPISKALVWFKDAETRRNFADDGIYTDAAGSVTLDVPRGRPVTLQVNPEGYLGFDARTIDAEAVAAGPVEVALTPGLSISGRVLRFDGKPARRVHVSTFDPRSFSGMLRGFAGGGGSDAETDDEGRFELTGVAAGEHGVGVAGANWRAVASVIAKAGARNIEIRLDDDAKPIRKVTVRVTGPGGAPIHEVRTVDGVHLDGDLGSGGGGVLSSTETTIYFAPSGGNYEGFFEAWDARGKSGERLPYGHLWLEIPDDAPDPWVLELPTERFVEGIVVRADGKPVGGATIVVSSSSHGRAMWELATVETAPDGRFRIGGLGPTDYHLAASAVGHLETGLVVQGGDTGAEIRLGVGKSVRLHVLDADGEPIAGAWIRVLRCEPTQEEEDADFDRELPETDAEGRAVLPGLHPNVPYDLMVGVSTSSDEDGYFPFERKRWSPADIEVRLDRETRIEGFVRTPGGAPVREFAVEAAETEGPAANVELGTTAGRFAVRPLREGAQVRIQARAGAATSNETVVAAGTRDAVLTLDLGAWFRVELDEATRRRLEDSFDIYADDISVHVFPGGVAARLSSAGAATVAGLDGSATYTLLVGPNDAGRFAEAKDVRADGRTVTVALIDGLPIEGTLQTAEGATLEGIRTKVLALREGVAVARAYGRRGGTFRFPGLPPGGWTLRVVAADGGHVLGEVEAEAGDEQVTVTLHAR